MRLTWSPIVPKTILVPISTKQNLLRTFVWKTKWNSCTSTTRGIKSKIAIISIGTFLWMKRLMSLMMMICKSMLISLVKMNRSICRIIKFILTVSISM